LPLKASSPLWRRVAAPPVAVRRDRNYREMIADWKAGRAGEI